MFNVYFALNYGLFSMFCIDLIFQAIVKEIRPKMSPQFNAKSIKSMKKRIC